MINQRWLMWMAFGVVASAAFAVAAQQPMAPEAPGEMAPGMTVEEAVPVDQGEALPPEIATEEIPAEMPPEEPLPPEEAAPPARPAPVRPMPVRPRISQPGRPSARGAAPAEIVKSEKPEDDPLPKEGGTPTEAVTFDFEDVPLTEVIKAIGRMTGKNFDIDPSIAATRVTVVTHDKIPPEMAFAVLEALLTARGFSLVETIPGHLLKVTPTGEDVAKIPLVKGTETSSGAYDTLATHIVNVKYADAGEVAQVIQKLGTRTAVVDAYQLTNTLIITDTTDGLRRMFAVLEEIDLPGYDTQMEIFTLEYARAEVLSEQVQQVLTDTGGGGVPAAGQRVVPTAVRPQRLPVRPSVPGQNAPSVVGSSEQILRIVPDERLNALIVTATTALMDRVRDLVSKLDTPTPYERNSMNVYHLLNADAEMVETALNAMLGTTPRTATDKAPATSGEVQPFEKKVVITRYEATNSLLVLASPQDYKLIKEIIAQLDVPQRQVLVEAIIMDVSVQDTFGLSVDAAGLTGNDGFGLSNTSNLAQIFKVTDLATGLADGTAGVSVASSLLTLGSTGGMAAGIYDSFDITVDGQQVEVPFIPLLLRALSTLTDIDILSQPSLTTQDNEPSDIIVGQEIPVPTQRQGYTYDPRTGQQQQTSGYGLTSYGSGISREDVGVKMKVTPHINEGDYVSIETEIEVSEATPSSVGIDANELGPTFNKTKVNNNVVVKDGTTGVIGGLIKETASHTSNQTPGLSDIPLLGWMFKTRNDTRKKQNVVVLITPFIIKDGVDLDRVTDFKMKEFRDKNVDVLFERGFIKRIKKRHQMRSDFRPSVNRSEEMLNSGGFGRGDIER